MDRYLERGWSSDRIAADTGWSGQYVRDRLREHQIPLRRRNESPPGRRADHAQVLTWLEQGVPVAEVAHRSGYTPSGIYALLQRHGRPAPGPQPRPRPIEAADVGALYRQGLSLAAIGDRYGRSADWARARVLAAGTPLRGGGRRPVIDPAAVHHGLSEGLPLAEIAQRLDCHPETVRLIVIAQGWPVPARRPRGRVLPLAPVEAVRRLYVQEGKSVADTAEALGVSVHQVKLALDHAGVVRRTARPRRVADPDPAALRRLYLRERLTVSAIARQFGVKRWRIERALSEHGITRENASFDMDAVTLNDLYVEQQLDDVAIGARYAVPPYQVRMRREQLGVRRPASMPPRSPAPEAPPAEQLRRWYEDDHQTLADIAHACHTSVPKVRAWMRQAGVSVKARTSRSHRQALDPEQLRTMYLEYQWSAREIAAELDVTPRVVLRALHDHGIPVRTTRRHIDACKLLDMLYDDESVLAILDRHSIPVRSQPGSIADRFPAPFPLTRPLLRDAYLEIGLSARHIELLTGQPADQILDCLHASHIPVRTNLGMSPWLSAVMSTS